jgi:hypothetical protein
MIFVWDDTIYSGDYTISDSQIIITLSNGGKIIIDYSIVNNKVILTKITTPDGSTDVNYVSDRNINDDTDENNNSELVGIWDQYIEGENPQYQIEFEDNGHAFLRKYNEIGIPENYFGFFYTFIENNINVFTKGEDSINENHKFELSENGILTLTNFLKEVFGESVMYFKKKI